MTFYGIFGALPFQVPAAAGSPTLKLPGYGSVEEMRQALLRCGDAEPRGSDW